MKKISLASKFPARLDVPACPEPSRCPYCPADSTPHWIRWGTYSRYAGDPFDPCRREKVRRYRCKICKRTFSLPPDFLLPYCGIRTGAVLDCFHAFFSKKKIAVSKMARKLKVTRAGVRYLKTRFLRVLPKLRLPGREGFLAAPAFLGALSEMEGAEVAALFRDWKEREPKLSIVGVYAR